MWQVRSGLCVCEVGSLAEMGQASIPLCPVWWLWGLAEGPAGPFSFLPGVLGCSEQGLHHSRPLVPQLWEKMLPTRAHSPLQALAGCC